LICAFAFMSGKQYYAVQPVGVVAAFALVVSAGLFEPLRRALSLRPLVAFGVASYSIYLFHEPVIAYAEVLHHAPLWLGASASLGLSLVFFWVCERPFISGPLRGAMTSRLKGALVRALAFLLGRPGVHRSATRGADADIVSNESLSAVGQASRA